MTTSPITYVLVEDSMLFMQRRGRVGNAAQRAALTYFQQMDDQTLDLLGVEIVEGEHPGSSYFAAELRRSVEEANRAAEKASLPVRFKAITTLRVQMGLDADETPIHGKTPEERKKMVEGTLRLMGKKPSDSADDPNRPETEEDGIRAEALRRSRVDRLLRAPKGRTRK